MYYQNDPNDFRILKEGVNFKSLVHGEKTHLCEFHLDKGTEIPLHAHPHEQTGYLVSGRLRFEIDGKSHDAVAGCSWSIPGGTEHRVDTLEDAVVIEVFSPAREDYL